PLLLTYRRPPTAPLFPYTTLFRSTSTTEATASVRRTVGELGSGSYSTVHPAPVSVPVRSRITNTSVTQKDTCTTAPRPTATDSQDRKSTRLNSSHVSISYAVSCLK